MTPLEKAFRRKKHAIPRPLYLDEFCRNQCVVKNQIGKHLTMKKLLRMIAGQIRMRSTIGAGCLDGWKMYKHTKKYHGVAQNRFVTAFFGGQNPKVTGGPFSGLCYENRIYFGPVTPRWLGTYEKELWEVVRKIEKFAPEEIVDIGSAEGYYSLGLSNILRETPVYSYETNPLSIWQQTRLKKLNSIKNLYIRRYCDKEQLASHGKGRSVIISDIEGFEMVLFSPEVVSKLDKSLVIIEVHNHAEHSLDNVSANLISRFSPTHSIIKISTTKRTIADWEFDELGNFSAEEKLEFMDEYRNLDQHWLICEPASLGHTV